MFQFLLKICRWKKRKKPGSSINRIGCRLIEVSEKMPKSIAGQHICNQVIRSGTAPALPYGEAQRAESRDDFIHKMKAALKELRATYNCLRLIRRLNWYSPEKVNLIYR